MIRIFRAFLVLALLFQGLLAFSQRHYLSTDLLSPTLRRHGAVKYERYLEGGQSLALRFEVGRYYFKKNMDFNQEIWRKGIYGYAFTPEYRRYWQSTSRLNRPVGPFYGAYGKFFSGWYEQEFTDPGTPGTKETFVSAGLGGLLGYKYKRPDQLWFVEALAGLGWGNKGPTKFEYESYPNQALLWRIELSLGYSFW